MMVPLLRKKESVNLGGPFAGANVVVSRIVVSMTEGTYVATGKRDEGTVEGSAVGKESSDSPLGPAYGV